MRNSARSVAVATTLAASLICVAAGRAADAPHVSGGVGLEAREELRVRESEYNLTIVASAKTGEYLANTWVLIESARKERVLKTEMAGPLLLVKLAPGTYTIKATYGGDTLTRTVTIAREGRQEAHFQWDVPR